MILTSRLRRAGRVVTGAFAADRAAATLGQLKGGAQKLGQTLALVADGMPPDMRARFGALFTEGEPRPWEEVQHLVPAIVATVEPTPFAAASLGQVHRGTLADGTVVAVKLLYPGVGDALRADLDNLATAAVPARMVEGGTRMLVGLREALLAELDLRNEARHAGAIAEALRPWPRLRVAAPIYADEFALVTPLLAGRTLHLSLRPMGPGPKDPRTLGDDLIAAVYGPVFTAGIINADAHPGNVLVQPDGLGLVDFGAVAPVSEVPELAAALDQLLRGETKGALEALGLNVGVLEPELRPLLGPLGPGAWNFAEDTLTARLAEIKRRHPFAVREVPFTPGRLPLLRATLGVLHALRRLGVPYALGESLARVRAEGMPAAAPGLPTSRCS